MNHPILTLIAVLIFCVWCLIADHGTESMGTDNIFHAMSRVIARHIKLVLRFLLGIGIAFVAVMSLFEIGRLVSAPVERSIANGGGPQTERFSRFMNEATWPVQYMLDGFTTMLGVFAALTLLFFEKFCHWYLIHGRVRNLALLVFYAIWLVWNVWKIMGDVFNQREIAILYSVFATGLVIGAEVAVVIHLWPALSQIQQVVVAHIYPTPRS